MSKVLYGKYRFEGSALQECQQQMAGRRVHEQQVMEAQKTAELEEIRQAKKERARQRNSDRARSKARRLAWERKYRGN